MKKTFIAFLIFLIVLSGCQNTSRNTSGRDERYFDMLSQLENVENFSTAPINYNISVELSSIEGGYRFYVIIDEPKVAMYNIQAMAIVEGDDYSQTMAANVGIFEDVNYAMIPNQKKVDDGYVAGLSISGITQKDPCAIDVVVRYETSKLDTVYREYYRYEVSVGDSE